MSNFPVQTRSEELGLRYFSSVTEAIEYANANPSVWKVSVSVEGADQSVRLIRHNANWLARLFGAKTKWIVQELME
jgi:hypothetical protein